MNLEDFVPAATREALANHGLHKVAGAMYGVDELSIKEAARLIGTRAYLRRKEARVIATGLAALGTVTNEKVAENPLLMALLRRSVMPAALGAGVAAVPHILSDDPNKGSPLPSMAAGALLGGVGGSLNALGAVGRSSVGPHAAHVVQNFDKMPVI